MIILAQFRTSGESKRVAAGRHCAGLRSPPPSLPPILSASVRRRFMNPKPRFSFSVASAIFIFVLLCFAPGALGQSANNGREASSGIVLSQTLPGLFVFGLDPHHHDPDG